MVLLTIIGTFKAVDLFSYFLIVSRFVSLMSSDLVLLLYPTRVASTAKVKSKHISRISLHRVEGVIFAF